MIFKSVMVVVSMLLSLSPVTDMIQIYRNKSTGPKSIIPLLASCCNSHVWMWYGVLSAKYFPVSFTSGFSQLCAAVFISTYYYWSSERRRVRTMLFIVLALLTPVFGFSIATLAGVTGRSSAQAAYIVGFVGSTCSLINLSAPMERVKTVLRTKSAAALPAGMCTMSLISASLWMTYGFLYQDLFLLVPNSCGVLLCSSQVALCFIYRDRKSAATVTDPSLCEPIAPVRVQDDCCCQTQSVASSTSQVRSRKSMPDLVLVVETPKETAIDAESFEYTPMRSPAASLASLAPTNA